MSQVITNAFEQYWQSSLAAEQPVVLDEFVLADIPNLDITAPIDPDTGLPPAGQIVHRQNVDQRGRINNNAVAYTIVMDTTVGDFSFNAMYLRNKANGVIGMIVYKGRETKLKTDQTTGQTGNSLVKSMLMGYDQAAEATLTNVDAGTWQIDYAARLRGQDEDLRQLASQLYGHHTFIGDGFKVVQQDGGHQVTQGVAIVGGLRIELKQLEVIHPGTLPIGVWVDVHRSGSLLSEHQNHFTIITSVADLTDHVDESGYPHYVAKLATVQADSTVIDGRGQGGSGGSGAIPDTFALWKRSMAEAGLTVKGLFVVGGKVDSASDVLIDEATGKVYAYTGLYPHTVIAGETPEFAGWADRSDVLLANFVAKSITSPLFAGGADPTGSKPADIAFAAAAAYVGDVRVDGVFTLSNPVTRTKSVMELPPGSTITKNKLAGPSTANGAGIPSKTMFGRLVIRDEDTTPIGSDSFAAWPDMGQALRLDSKQVQGQCGMFLGGDRRSPIIGGTAYVGLHSRHDQSVATSKIWGINPIVVKNVRAVDLPPGVDSETIGMEISVANNTDERGQPQGAGMVEGLFVSYVAYTGEGSCAITTGGLTAGWRTGLWLDGVTPEGTHIQLRDENSANAGVRCGIDTSGVSSFSESAILLGRGHSVASLDTTGSIKPLMYISPANEMVHGSTLPHRFIGSISVFDHSIRPATDNIYDYGSAVYRGRTAYFGTGTINTSDERNKPIIERIPDSLLDAWGDVDWGNRFKFDDAIAEKGADGARWHFGLIAQWVRDALSKHGIDGFSLGLLCYDEWDDEYTDEQVNIGETVTKTKLVTVKKSIKQTVKESKTVRNEAGDLVLVEIDVVKEDPVLVMEYVKDIDGNFVIKEDGTKMTVFTQATEDVEKEYEAPAEPVYVRKLVKAAGNRYGIRYEEALSLEAAFQRRERERDRRAFEALKDDLIKRIAELEKAA
ncbi:phage tail protein [Aeromonas taiwanensis]|uniref:phage tail-collar fiber domain-containing protein n=1 Tax=Aeromonas taiwanensis TaxID=633417 RepID=UPI003988B544